jgi:hypothetical protein
MIGRDLNREVGMKQNIIKITLFLMIGLLFGVGVLVADDDYERDDEHEHDDDQGFFERWFGGDKQPNPDKAEQHFYVQGCGGCHFPYQPGLLPTGSWEKIMAGLEDHFGDNAELSEEEAAPIRKFLLDNAADKVNRGLSNRVMSSLGDDPAPLRITDTHYFRHEHDEIHGRMVTGNPEVGSFSNCDACHTYAMKGSFDEHQVRIPGYGRWDD